MMFKWLRDKFRYRLPDGDFGHCQLSLEGDVVGCARCMAHTAKASGAAPVCRWPKWPGPVWPRGSIAAPTGRQKALRATAPPPATSRPPQGRKTDEPISLSSWGIPLMPADTAAESRSTPLRYSFVDDGPRESFSSSPTSSLISE